MACVLIVDADARVRSTLRGLLERRRHDVHEAATGTGGAEFAIRLGVEILFTDVLAPDIDGLELIKEVRAALPDVRIVAMSGGESAQTMAPLAAAVNLGAVAFLVKPFSVEDVVAVLDEIAPPE